MISTTLTTANRLPPHAGGILTLTGDTIADTGIIVGSGLLGLWLLLILREQDAEAGTDRWLSLVGGVVIGVLSIGFVVLDSAATVIAEAPGFVATGIASLVGYLSLEGAIELTGGELVGIVAVAVLVTLAIRSGGG